MWRRDRKFKQVDLADLNPVRYKKKQKPYNKISVSGRDNKSRKMRRVNWPFVIAFCS